MSRAYLSTPISELTDAELREILVTCDGRGKDVKGQALDLLIDRVRIRGLEDGIGAGHRAAMRMDPTRIMG